MEIGLTSMLTLQTWIDSRRSGKTNESLSRMDRAGQWYPQADFWSLDCRYFHRSQLHRQTRERNRLSGDLLTCLSIALHGERATLWYRS